MCGRCSCWQPTTRHRYRVSRAAFDAGSRARSDRRSTKQKVIRSVLIAMLTVFVLGLQSPALPASAATLLPVRLGAMPIDTAAEAFYALDQGFFTAAGLDVTLTILNNGATIAAAASAGALDIGFGSPSPVLMAHLGGLPIWFIAPAAVWDGKPQAVLVVAKGSPIHTGADLNGKTIAVAGLHDLTQYTVQAWIDRNGGNSASVQFLELPYAQMGLALEQGRVNAATAIQPFISQMSAGTTILGSLSVAPEGRYLLAGWFAMTSYIEQNPEAVRRFALAMRQTARWANTHPKETAAILERYTKMDPAQVAVTTRAHYADDARFDPQLLQPVIDIMVHYGKVNSIPASNLIWPTFLPATPAAH
jgi:NitT/TauT family transport system substrate-binding protein